MGLFSKGVCPICYLETGWTSKSSCKYNDDYICQNCLKKILGSKVYIGKIKEMPVDELQAIVNNYDVQKVERKEQDRRIVESYNRGKQIKQVMILNTVNDSQKSFSSSVVRGAVGSVLGPVGAVGGALSGKNKVTSTTTFLIEYMNGNKVTKTVDNNSKEYKELCKYISI